MPEIRRIFVELDPERAARGLAGVAGTVVLDPGTSTGLGFRTGRKVLLFAPSGVARHRPDGRAESSGCLRNLLEHEAPLGWAHILARSLAANRHGVFVPRVAGWHSFDFGAALHGARHERPHPSHVDDVWMAAYSTALLFGDGRPPELVAFADDDLSPSRSGAHALVDRALALLREAEREPGPTSSGAIEVTPLDRGWHRRAVRQVHEHLLAGDTYQINLTGFVALRGALDAYGTFVRECQRNPVGFAAFLRTEHHAVTSHSPELLLRLDGGEALTAPIKGTADASSHEATDDLRASAKDRAEHVMIVDLCRHDLGRVANTGTVHVRALMHPLHLRGLVHLVSEIAAHVPTDRRGDLFGALFPGGSITGAPKRRSCDLIRELEPVGRGIYTGSVGMIDAAGRQDWNIAIRTAVWQNAAAWFGCGGGIVLDSDADREYEEAMLKAKSFLESVLGDRAGSGIDSLPVHGVQEDA